MACRCSVAGASLSIERGVSLAPALAARTNLANWPSLTARWRESTSERMNSVVPAYPRMTG